MVAWRVTSLTGDDAPWSVLGTISTKNAERNAKDPFVGDRWGMTEIYEI
jgi:hypothetical protein